MDEDDFQNNALNYLPKDVGRPARYECQQIGENMPDMAKSTMIRY